MDPIEPVLAERNYHELKESSIIAKSLLFRLFIFAAVLTILIIVWKNQILQFILSTTAVLAMLVAGWYVFTQMRTEKAQRVMRRSQGQADSVVNRPVARSALRSEQASVDEVLRALEESNNYHGVKNQGQLSESFSNTLRQRFPNHKVAGSVHHSGTHKVMVGNDVEFHVKVADKKNDLNEAVKKFQPSQDKEPAFVILDMGKMDISSYVEELQKKGAKVVVLKKGEK